MRSRITLLRRWTARRFVGTSGAATVELALATPVLLTLVMGATDFGNLFNRGQSIAAATRVGAQSAIKDPVCQAGIQVLNTPQVSTACRDNIRSAAQNSRNFSPALTFPSSFALTCYCAAPDAGGTMTFTPVPTSPAGTCGNYSCAANGMGHNTIFITVSASQAMATPLFPWPGFPTTLTGRTEVRLQ